jgi:hypothetical protein
MTHGGSSELEVLPDDILASVLGRLPPSSLAASRCVRKHWCSIIDARRLLRADLLPLRLDAFFTNPGDIHSRPTFFSRPSSPITGRFDFHGEFKQYLRLDIEDHCNGLLLLADMVVNPATRQAASLPDPPLDPAMPILEEKDLYPSHYLVYDPMVSPQQYEVYTILEPFQKTSISSEQAHVTEWPPSPYVMHVFSSRKWMWEERSFVRQGEAAGTIADFIQFSKWEEDCHAVYFRGTLYVHCRDDSVMRYVPK